jgi:hypothetical protein
LEQCADFFISDLLYLWFKKAPHGDLLLYLPFTGRHQSRTLHLSVIQIGVGTQRSVVLKDHLNKLPPKEERSSFHPVKLPEEPFWDFIDLSTHYPISGNHPRVGAEVIKGKKGPKDPSEKALPC